MAETLKNLDFAERLATHRIMVRSTYTTNADSKTFRVHAPDYDNDTLCIIIRRFVEHSQENGVLREFVTVTNEKRKNTHIVMVLPVYAKDRVKRDDGSRSFHIANPSFNSAEIAAVIREYLTGEKS